MKLLLLALLFFAPAAFAQTGQKNHLEGEDSPYLLQHLYNPVDWYPWGEEALEKARAENKLIFVSVGYASCHWCRVMADESFENEGIAEILNEHFVSIKIDRERRPDLDEQYLLATQLLTGSGGWPNTVFLSPGGDPFHGGTYFPPAEFQTLLLQLVDRWKREPATVIAEGGRLSEFVRNALTQTAEARELTPEVVNLAAQSVLEATDPFSGGIGDTSKFPRESLFLFMLDQAERTGDGEMLAGVTGMLDGMIRGGIHDHVGGGFHRYAIDPDWQVPHFEKMLYTQAMTGRLLVRAWRSTGNLSYRRAAERLFSYVLRELRGPDGGFYSAQDADSVNAEGAYVEGAYYTWTPDDLGNVSQSSAFLAKLFEVSAAGDLDGASVLNWGDDPGNLAEEMGITEAAFYAGLDPLLDELLAARANRPTPAPDEKILMAWNGVMIATLAEAAYVFERPDYLAAAEAAARLVLDQMQSDQGFTRVYFDGKASIPAQLPDYAGFGLALLALHDYSPNLKDRAFWLTQARQQADYIRALFGDAQDGYRMNVNPEGISAIISVDDTEISSGNAMALALFSGLSKRQPAPELELDATRLAGALSGLGLELPDQRAAALHASQDLQFGETGPVRFVSGGAVRVEFVRNPEGNDFQLNMSIKDGWHINAHEPLEDYFIPMELLVDGQPVAKAAYPVATVKPLGFNPLPLALYEGDISLTGQAQPGTFARLILQACSDEICLQPEELSFYNW